MQAITHPSVWIGSSKDVDHHTMLAAVVAGPERSVVRPQAIPKPEESEVLLRLEGCGVCASNLVPWSGPPWIDFPMKPGAMGHEAWGVVAEVGGAVDGFAVGDRVAALTYNSYATHDIAPADAIVRLPHDLDGLDFPAEPLGCAMNIFRRSRIKAGETVAIVGIGFLGALLTRLAAGVGARVIAISRREYALDMAMQMGAAETVPLDDRWPAIERVRALTDGRLCDCVIEATGKQGPLDLSTELIAEGGRMVVAGYHQDGPRQVNMQLWNWRGIDVINAHERDPAVCLRGIREAVDAVQDGRIDLRPLLTHRYPLDRLDDALQATRDRPDGFMKAVIVFP